MRLSIIIPTYNEAAHIEAFQQQLANCRSQAQVIFADSNSTDGTADMIHPEFTVVHAPSGRGAALNAGAAVATGDVLFFCHADSQLPADFIDQIETVMQTYRVGCFGVAWHSRHFFMWTNRVASNFRAKYRHIMFGDQGIFIERTLFEQLGGFPPLPLMEDYQFSLTLKQRGIKPGMTKSRIYTSDRKYPKQTIGMLKMMAHMWKLRKMYRDGVPADHLAKIY